MADEYVDQARTIFPLSRVIKLVSFNTSTIAETEISLRLDSDDLARVYDSNTNYHIEGGKLLVEKMGISSGWCVFDIGCGTGVLASHVADLVGPCVRVVGLEPLEKRVEITRSKVQAKPNLSFKVGDAQDLSRIPSGSADGVYLNSVIHWVPDRLQAIKEAYRVLKPGGRIGIATGSGKHPQPHGIIRSRVLSGEQYAGYAGPRKDRPNPTQSELEDLLAAAGFGSIDVVLHSSFVETDDAKAMVDFIESFSFGNYLGHLPEDLRRSARRYIELEFEFPHGRR